MIRMVLAALIAFLLIPAELRPRLDEPMFTVSRDETLNAANTVLEDVGGFCERNQDACITGKTLIEEATESVRSALYEWSKARSEGDEIDPSPDAEMVVDGAEN